MYIIKVTGIKNFTFQSKNRVNDAFVTHTMTMLDNNIIKEKSDMYFEQNLKQNHQEGNDDMVKTQFYHFVNNLFQRVIANDSSDFSEEESKLIEDYNIDLDPLLDYFKADIKNFIVESGKNTPS